MDDISLWTSYTKYNLQHDHHDQSRLEHNITLNIITHQQKSLVIVRTRTFKRSYTLLDEEIKVHISHEGTSTCGPKKNLRNTELLCSIKSKAHTSVGYNTTHRRDIISGVDPLEKLLKRSETVLHGGIAKGNDVLRSVHVSFW